MPTDERVLSDDEVGRLWAGLDTLDEKGTRRISTEAALYIRLLLTCGTRRTETALAEWRDIEAGEGHPRRRGR